MRVLLAYGSRGDVESLAGLAVRLRAHGAEVRVCPPPSCTERLAEAIEVVRSKRDSDGRWPLENQHPGTIPVELDEGEGRPSRWNTLRALRVLDWYNSARA